MVLGLLAGEPHAVVERQPVVHPPVVLRVELGVVVDHAAFDQLRLLEVLREHPRRRVGKAEARIEGVVGVVAEVDVALESEVRHATGAGVLGLEAVVVVEAQLERVGGLHLRQTDGNVLGSVDVQEPWKDLIGRPGQGAHAGGALDSAAPPESRRQGDLVAVEPARSEIGQDAERVVALVDHAGIWIEQRKARQARQVGGRVDEDATRSGGADRGASGELVSDEPVRALDVRRVVNACSSPSPHSS